MMVGSRFLREVPAGESDLISMSLAFLNNRRGFNDFNVKLKVNDTYHVEIRSAVLDSLLWGPEVQGGTP